MITLEGYEEAFIGFTERFQNNKFIAIYDRNKCIDITMKKMDLDHEKAIEWFEYNVDAMDKGEETPIVIHPMSSDQFDDLAEYLWGHRNHMNENKKIRLIYEKKI
tara:strand:- start:2372 stop:2686 length:315 start_codon:yes stop_codon:yes gene_type:complete